VTVFVFCTKIQHHRWSLYTLLTANCGFKMNNIDSSYEILYSCTSQQRKCLWTPEVFRQSAWCLSHTIVSEWNSLCNPCYSSILCGFIPSLALSSRDPLIKQWGQLRGISQPSSFLFMLICLSPLCQVTSGVDTSFKNDSTTDQCFHNWSA
jgi:hypothetical protein